MVECYSPIQYEMAHMQQGKVSAEAGRCAAEWVIAAVQLAMAERVDGIVTAPLNKEAMHKGGYKYGGHTELLAEHSGSSSSRPPRRHTHTHATRAYKAVAVV